MPADGPLFIVDNAPGGRRGLDYLREWTEIATRFDIATGFFDVGALIALDGHWQLLDGLRILMGDELGAATKKALLAGVKARAMLLLDESLEAEKGVDPFLEGADAITEALAEGRIDCRVYNRDKFHAKAYITHGRLDIVGPQALVGSSNFTRAGLTQNVELNIRLESSSEVNQLQNWYEEHWRLAEPVSADILKTIARHTNEYAPFDAYAGALRSLVSRRDPGDSTWDQHSSRMYPKLDRYQQEAYSALIDIADQHGGALLCDGVGLGKTFVGLMLIERLILREGKRVVLLAPKAVSEAVWQKDLKEHLPHVGGSTGAGDFSSLTVINHTDLSRGGDFPERIARMTELADAVVIDEAHHFRNRGRKPVDNDPETWSRYHRLADLIRGGGRPKQVFELTATPVNNSLSDFRHLIELFSGEDDARFSQTLGVPSVTGNLNALTQRVRQDLDAEVEPADAPDVLQDVLSDDPLFQGLVVQRSRDYARKSQILETGEATAFPHREEPVVTDYSLDKGHGRLLDLLDESFQRDKPLFSLAIYYPLAFYTGDDESLNPIEENRQKQVVGLIRTNFLKRFESSLFAFERSCDRLMRRLLAFLRVNATAEKDRRLYERWVQQHEALLGFIAHRQLELLGEEVEEEDEESDDVVPPEMLARLTPLDPDDFDMQAIFAECILDLDQIAKLLEETRGFTAKDDDKLRALRELLEQEAEDGRKVLVFTEFADTARYLKRQLQEAGMPSVEELDGSRGVDRAAVIKRFAPYYNGSSSGELDADGGGEIQILIATDVLSEGLNLQDATRLVNFDIHWNPVRLMQRIGRVDRRLNPDVEDRIIADHPELTQERGRVAIHNFLPPKELDTLLKLYEKVSYKTLLISKTLGIEGRRFLMPTDDYDALREFNAAYEGSTSRIEELHLEYQELLVADPDLDARLAGFPAGLFSGRTADREGVFFCFELPAFDVEHGAFTLAAGMTRWYFVPSEGETVEELGAIAQTVRSTPETPRVLKRSRSELRAQKTDVEKHIKNTYLKALNAPLDAPAPRLVSWMELSAA